MRWVLVSKYLLLLYFIACLGVSWGNPAQGEKGTALGQVVPNFSYLDTDKVRRNLTDLPGREAYVFVFGLLDCPLARRIAPTLAALSKEFQPKGVEFIGLYGTQEDSILDIASYRLEMNLPFTVGKDFPEADLGHPEREVFAAELLGVRRSPQVAVLDKNHHLIYRGRVDGRLGVMGSRPGGAALEEGELHRALRLLLAGTPEITETPVQGCVLNHERPDPPADAAQLTFYRDIAPIVQKHCWECHKAGGEAPFALVTYRQIKSHSATILSVVRDEVMPPAFSQKKTYQFLNHREVSAPEKAKLEAWIRRGMPEGSPSESTVTPPPASTSQWRIGTPDYVVTFPKDHLVKADGKEEYLTVRLPGVFLRDTWVESIEILPTNKPVTHHANLVYWNVYQWARTGVGASEKTFLTGYVPGGIPLETRKVGNGIAMKIPAFSVLGMQLHYVPNGRDEQANIKIGIRYYRGTVRRSLHNLLFFKDDFRLPPQDGNIRLTVRRKVDHAMDVVGFFPHMHLRGRAMWLSSNRGKLLEVPSYNFGWQTAYILRPGTRVIQRGTTLTYDALYDNSDMNTFNPDPSRWVLHGERTQDEMFMGFLYYLRPDEVLNLRINPANGHQKWW